MANTTKKYCVIYARVSSKDQEREGFSIPAQLELLREYAKRNGFKVDLEFTEAETAKSAGRKKFGMMMDFIKKSSHPVMVLVEKTDRLYRNMKDHVLIDELIKGLKTEIHLVKEGEILSETVNSHSKMVHRFKTIIAQGYVENLSEEVRKGQRQSVLEGNFPWPAPYGYEKINKAMVPHPQASRFVQMAFSLYSSGLYSIDACIQKLYEAGLIYQPYAHKIGKTKLNELLKSRIYIGQIEFKEGIYQGKHEPLVDLETWLAAQRNLRKGNKPVELKKKEFAYRGWLTCGECGKPLVGESKKGGRYTYYRCVAMKEGCSQGYINENKIDEAAQEAIKSMSLTESFKADMLEAVKGLDEVHDNTYKDELAQIQSQLTRARNSRKKAYMDRVNGMLDDDLWIEISQETQNQIDLLEAKIQQLNKADASYYEIAENYLELPERLTRSWTQATDEEKRVLLNLFTSNFLVKEGKAVLELKEPFYYLSKMASCSEWRSFPDVARTFLASHSKTIKAMYKALAA